MNENIFNTAKNMAKTANIKCLCDNAGKKQMRFINDINLKIKAFPSQFNEIVDKYKYNSFVSSIYNDRRNPFYYDKDKKEEGAIYDIVRFAWIKLAHEINHQKAFNLPYDDLVFIINEKAY